MVDAARALVTAHEFKKAIPLLQELNAGNLDTPRSNALLGYCHQELRHFRLAEFHYTLAVDVEKPTLEAVLGLADALSAQYKGEEAMALLDRIPHETLSNQQSALVLAAKGNVASFCFEPDAAVGYYRGALILEPIMWTSWLSLGHSYFELGDIEGAGNCYDRAFLLSDNFWTRFHLSVFYHLVGRHLAACELAEARLLEPKLSHLQLDLPNWDGEPCDTLVVFTEGGLGDILLHTRYVTAAAARCKRVIFSTWEKVIPLVQAMRLGVNVEVVNRPETDATMKRASLMSLPLYLSMPSPEEAPPATHLNLALPLPKKNRPRIALTWFGDPKFPHGVARDATLTDFEGLIRAYPEVEWLCFSPEPRAGEDIEKAGLADVVRQVALPLEEAVIEMATCDAAVTVDTAHAHLFALVGVPVMMLVYKIPGVYWGLASATTPYYPGMSLFRQVRARSWVEPIEEVRRALEAWLQPGGHLGEHPGAASLGSAAGPGGGGGLEECT